MTATSTKPTYTQGQIREGVTRNADGTITVTLTTAEFAAATRAAADRMDVSAVSGLNHATTYKRDPVTRLQEEVIGTCGEIAWAKAKGQTWHAPLNTFHHEEDGGAGSGEEIRATHHTNGSLILRDNDPDNRVYILVTGDGHTMTIHGGIRGSTGKADRYLRNPGKHRLAWFVPQTALWPVPDTPLGV